MVDPATAALSFVVEAALGVWLGKILFFSFVGAPKTFEALPREDAGDVVNEIFPAYYLMGIMLGVLAFAASVVLGYLQGYGLVLGIVFLGSGVGVILDLYARQVLSPRIRRDEDFEKHHRRSVLLNAATLALVAGALAASHLYVNPVYHLERVSEPFRRIKSRKSSCSTPFDATTSPVSLNSLQSSVPM